ncbi:hypothetical protein PR048_031512 [Dryococelus australis]|uniref:Uncharacterized protein n=1 Tax=Dryococelus australis TaxID=614101 RepID=A0ABQ9G5H4_9NEOP|nr:hypothetical protein PR048_031512 [Dryococelus australis]
MRVIEMSSNAGMKGRMKLEIPDKTRRTAIATCENPGVTRLGIEPVSPWVGGEQANRSDTAAPNGSRYKIYLDHRLQLSQVEAETRGKQDVRKRSRKSHASGILGDCRALAKLSEDRYGLWRSGRFLGARRFHSRDPTSSRFSSYVHLQKPHQGAHTFFKFFYRLFMRWNEGQGKREIPEKTHRSTASSGTILPCENPVTWSDIQPGSPWWEASGLTARPPRPLPNERVLKNDHFAVSRL